jgi:hypothetical protein
MNLFPVAQTRHRNAPSRLQDWLQCALEKRTILHTFVVTGLILALFYAWFGVADRYHIFLYNHLGATPFDPITTSRYLMSGLVADGVILVGYTIICWFLGRYWGIWWRPYDPPPWSCIWLLSLPVLLIGIPLITLTANTPTLPPLIALCCALITCGGLALALWPGQLSARQPSFLMRLLLTGGGLAPILLFLRAVELPGKTMLTAPTAFMLAASSILVSVGWLAGCVWCSHRLTWTIPSAVSILLSAFALTYLLLPLVHHFLFTPVRFRYITSSTNFFAYSLPVQLLVWVIAFLFALLTSRLGYRS